MLSRLDDHFILEAYEQSVELNLDLEFISLLKEELVRRGLLDEFQTDLAL
ncbi:sporulation histidine kinase inhibitor Sda [Alkalihalobacillus sp. MEB130]|nr:sporulation histidine kinase inhibitor Sda [Alkalihalobacillus sp. MEB130]MDT8859857.1 sporulation histidine kinase inhibitor Sda [Alkalihalobacillus sp. MEB130]